MPNYFKKSRSFNALSKADKLTVLGTIFNALMAVPAKRVYLDNIMGDAPNGCGSMGCVIGWSAARRKSADVLGLKVDKDGVLYLKNGDQITHDEVFEESEVSDFLFGAYTDTLSSTDYYQPKRTALARLLYLGHLINFDLWVDSDWDNSGSGVNPGAIASRALKDENHWVNRWLDYNGGDANTVLDSNGQQTGRGEGNPW